MENTRPARRIGWYIVSEDGSAKINDTARPDEQPSYMDRRKEMSFRELREFIDDALRRLSDSDSDADRPRLKEEFDTLFEMLSAHLDALKAAAPEPAGPQSIYDVPYVSSWFEPSEELYSAYERRDDLLEFLNEARFDPSNRRYVEHLESELNPLEQEIAERESSEKQKHEKRRHEYLKVHEQYDRDLRLWEEKARRVQEWQQTVAFRARIVERVRKDIERKFRPEADVTTKHIRWRLLPPGELSEDRVRGYYTELQRKNTGIRYDPDRIVKALSLRPNQRYEEVGSVEGYAVFTFPYTSAVLMECPIVGNAIYVIHKDWERWSGMTKQELMADESGEVVRIIHRPGWFEEVKRELGVESLPTE